jgi:hypothetical protein
MTQAQIIDKYIDRIMIDYPEADKIHIDLVQFAEELRQCNVSGSACDLLRRLKEANMCSVIGDELIDEFLQSQADR